MAPTSYGQLCLAIDSMVAEGHTEEEILKRTVFYYSRLQTSALDRNMSMKVLAQGHVRRRKK